MFQTKPSKQLIFQLLFNCFLSFSIFAQNEIVVQDVASQIVKNFSEFHVQPRTIDDAFGADVHNLMLNSLDARKMLFTSENVEELKQLSSQIDNDIYSGQTVYLNRFNQLLKESIMFAEKTCDSFFETKIVITPIAEIQSELIENYPKKINQKKKWDLYLRNAVLDNVVANLSDEQYVYHLDSIDNLLAKSIKSVQSNFKDYFKNLSLEKLTNVIYLNAIAESYDPHSSYFSSDQMNQFNQELTSEREIFGINYYKNVQGEFEITNVYPGSSAWLSGEISEGDFIKKVKFGSNKEIELAGLTLFEVHQLFNENTSNILKLTLTNIQGEETSIELEKTKVYSDEDIVKTAILQGEKKIGFISLPDFYTNETDTSALGCANDVAKAIVKMKAENIEGLILDLRNNGGGSLKEAIDLSGIFIDFGPILINKDEEKNVYSLKDLNRGTIYKGPLIVMINQYSASASEIVAASLQDYNRALIVGHKTYGKATGQFVMPLDPKRLNPDWGFAKITNIGLYRIDLTSNQKRGVIPDIQLPQTNSDDFESESDYSTALTLDTINKKIYYTPLPKIQIEELKLKSENRLSQSLSIAKEKELYDRIVSIESECSKWNNGLDKRLELYKQIDSIALKSEQNIKTAIRNYEVAFLLKDSDLYSISPYLNKYRQNFKEELELDLELFETYSILLDWIK